MEDSRIDRQRELLRAARSRGRLATLGAYARLSGPGWLQSAITLGGGSLAGSLYLGVLGGFALLWLQPLAMILGIVMLSAIAYVTLSTGERPFRAINEHVNPVLGWGWAIATLMANLVWALPQFALGTAAVTQNLAPGMATVGGGEHLGRGITAVAMLVVASTVVLLYSRGGKGIKAFEILLKCMVAIIVLSFIGVVAVMSNAGALDWGAVWRGFVPDLRLLSAPADTFRPFLDAVSPKLREYWVERIVGEQRDVMITAAATAVGINMTFLLPYSMLRKGWDAEFRGLATFDLATGLFIPFVIATSCVVIAAATQFHTQPTAESGARFVASAGDRVHHELGDAAFASLTDTELADRVAALPAPDRRLAAMLVKRDALSLAGSLEPLTGHAVSHYVFGIGVLGMALSTIIILMLINGFVVCEMLGKPQAGTTYKLALLAPGLVGVLGPFLWGTQKASFWLAVPTSVFGMVLLPVAYFTFFLLFNQRSLMGEDLPRGLRRVVWNLLMGIAAVLAGGCSLWSLWSKQGWKGMAVAGAFVLLALGVQIARRKRVSTVRSSEFHRHD